MAVVLPLILALGALDSDVIENLQTTPSVPTAIQTEGSAAPIQQCANNDSCVITYPAGFFDRYNPITALDIIRNVPGFQIDDGDGSRGFAGAAGNVLINSERPATKSGSASSILSRIPASSVEKVDLIRGQTGGLDLRGQSVAVNVILRSDAGSTITWQAGKNFRFNEAGIFPSGEISYTDSAGDLTYTAGAQVERFRRRFGGSEFLVNDLGDILETRDELFSENGFRGELNLNGQLKAGKTTYRLNSSLSYFEENGGEVSERFPPGGTPISFVLQGDGGDSGYSAEIGGEVEREFSSDLTAKLITLYRINDNSNGGSLAVGATLDSAAITSVTQSDTINTESIIRTEIDYKGIKGHLLEFSAEGAINRLESAFSLLVDSNDGLGLTTIIVPGAETEVRELRGDLSVSDSFKVGQVAIDAIFAAELSNIEQTGGFEENRTFFFIKPSLTVTWSPNQTTQLRLRTLREIGQLDFFDFVSSTDLNDNELALGNPDLAPDTSWVFDATVEKRFGDIGAISFTGFYNLISDVSDVLPIGNGLEVPGNIGSGTRRGIAAELTLPLDRFAIKNGRFDFSGRYQSSEVTDPVTGMSRRLSSEDNWRVDFEFRQDLTAQRWAWGWNASIRDAFFRFGLDELDEFRRRPSLDFFVETTRFAGIKINLEIENLFNEGFDRRRSVFLGERGSSGIDFEELRERNSGRRANLTFSGTF